jgi:hypothetical protein
MPLAHELTQLVHAYIARRANRNDLEAWLSQHAQGIADGGDDARRLFGRVSMLLAELGYGHRQEAEVRTELEAYLRRQPSGERSLTASP